MKCVYIHSKCHKLKKICSKNNFEHQFKICKAEQPKQISILGSVQSVAPFSRKHKDVTEVPNHLVLSQIIFPFFLFSGSYRRSSKT